MSKPKYILESGKINGVEIDSDTFEKVGYGIRDREDLIENLIMWISEGNKCKELMKQDLKMLMNRTEEYLLDSVSTNEYVFEGDAEFNDICKQLLKLNNHG